MKNIIRISALMCAMAFLTTSCVKDELFDEPQQKPAAVGDEIIFGSRAGFENSDKTTRTVYSGETYKVGDATFERIDWIDSTDPEVMDRVQIYSPQAANGPVADYYVYDNSQADDADDNTYDIKDEGYLVKVQDNALQWGSKETHKFYAMYPATSSFKEEVTIAMGIRMDGTTLHGVVPSAQVPGTKGDKTGVEKVDGYGYVAHPNMDYAYMAAKAEASPEDGAVSLDFVPIVTALEIELLADQTMTISELYVSGDNEVATNVQYLAGAFTADLSDANWTGTYPTCTNQATYTHEFKNDKGESQTLTLNQEHTIYYSLGGQYTINKGEKLKFTVFLRPGVNYTNLKVGFSETGAAYLSKTLGADNVALTIPQHKKTQFKDVRLPLEDVVITWDASNWMEALPDDRELAYLSIPGTGGSFSFNYKGDDPEYYQQQNTDFNLDAQWKAGIRAFEFVVDRGADASASLADSDLECNKTSVDVKFGDTMNDLIDAVKTHKEECAVVIITYQPKGGWQSRARNANTFASNLYNWWDALSNENKKRFTKYTPTMQLGNSEEFYDNSNYAVGKILVLVRINQKDEAESGDFATASSTLKDCPFVIIDGCGTAKDRWGSRGYIIDNTPSREINNDDYSHDKATIIENYMHAPLTSWSSAKYYPLGCSDYIFKSSPKYGTSYSISGHTIERPNLDDTGLTLNFNFKTETLGVECWYQEWARVVPINMTTTGHKPGTLSSTGEILWFESLIEKMMNIEKTFIMAINSNPKVNKTIYINSLCGYLVTTNFADSYAPSLGSDYGGSGGDIKGLAKTVAIDAGDLGKFNGLNAWFEAMVNDSQMAQSTGPTGIIMMDYVEPTDLVIGTIISNNFKYSK